MAVCRVLRVIDVALQELHELGVALGRKVFVVSEFGRWCFGGRAGLHQRHLRRPRTGVRGRVQFAVDESHVLLHSVWRVRAHTECKYQYTGRPCT